MGKSFNPCSHALIPKQFIYMLVFLQVETLHVGVTYFIFALVTCKYDVIYIQYFILEPQQHSTYLTAHAHYMALEKTMPTTRKVKIGNSKAAGVSNAKF